MANPFRKIEAPQQATFTLEAVTRALIKEAGFHEGHWMVVVGFEHQGMNLTLPGWKAPRPTAIAAIKEMGLRRVDAPNDQSVDAAEVNPEQRIVIAGAIH
jgi:hypothetical protein